MKLSKAEQVYRRAWRKVTGKNPPHEGNSTHQTALNAVVDAVAVAIAATMGVKLKPEPERPCPASFSVGAIKGKRSYVKGKGKPWQDKQVHWDEVAIKGDVVLVSEYVKFYDVTAGGAAGKEYRSAVLHNPTWHDVFVRFKESIPVTGDYHHCFLEGVRKLPIHKNARIIGPKIYLFVTGS